MNLSLLRMHADQVAAVAKALLSAVVALLALLCAPAWGQQYSNDTLDGMGKGWTRAWVDVDGDGRDDFCFLFGDWDKDLRCYLHKSNGAVVVQTYPDLWQGKGALDEVRWLDVNGDGFVDICRHVGLPSARTVCRYGPSFSSGTETTYSYAYREVLSCSEGDCVTNFVPGVAVNDRFMEFADVSGDGIPDLCYAYQTSENPVVLDLRCRIGSRNASGIVIYGGEGAPWIFSNIDIGHYDWPRTFADFNGDGFADFCRVRADRALMCTPALPSGGFGPEVVSTAAMGTFQKEGATFIDINGDGKADFCRIEDGSAFLIRCTMSNGIGWEFGPGDISRDRISPNLDDPGHKWARWWVDINGDGLVDFCRLATSPDPIGSASPTPTSKTGRLLCRLGRGDGGFAPTSGGVNDGITSTGSPTRVAFAYSDVAQGGITAEINAGLPDGGRGFCDIVGNGIPTFCRPTFTTTNTGVTICRTWPTNGYEECYPEQVNQYGYRVGVSNDPPALQSLVTSIADGVGAETRISYLPLTSEEVYTRSNTTSNANFRALIVQPRSPVVFETRAWVAGGSNTPALTGLARYFFKDLRSDPLAGSRGFRERWIFTEGSNSLEHVVYFQGLGAIDTTSIENDRREIGLVKFQEKFAVANSVVPNAANTANLTPRNAALRNVTLAARSLNQVTPGVPTSPSPFVLLQRTTNALANTVPANSRYRFIGSSVADNWEWNPSTGAVVSMPKVTTATVMNQYGDVTQLTQTTETIAAPIQTWTKNTVNDYLPADTVNWILGRLTRATVTSTAPAVDDQLNATAATYGTSAGRSANAADAAGISGGTLSPVAFGDVQIGQSKTLTATLSSSGVGALGVSVPNVASVTGAGFAFVSTTCTTSLAAGSTCTVTVTMSPTAAQAYSGTLNVTTSAGVMTAALTGTGRTPSAQKSSGDNFSYTNPAYTGSGHFIGVQNNGYGPVTISSLSYTASAGNFNAWMAGSGTGSPNGGYCWPGAVIQPGESCGAWANDGNSTPGTTSTGTATIATSAGNFTYSGSFQSVGLHYSTATGATTPVTSGQSPTLYTMTITNGTPFVFYLPRRGAGGGVTTVARFTSGNAGNFVITASTCGGSIAAGGSCTVTIAAAGISSAGSYSTAFQPNGTFQQTGDGAGGTWGGVPNWLVNMGTALADVYVSNGGAVNVTATSTIATLASSAPSFGTVWYGATAPTTGVTFRNDGNVPMTLTGLSGLSSMFSVTANSCSNVAPGAQCSMTVRMATNAAGSGPNAVATVGATTNASFNISGAVHSAVSRWSATSLAFGNVTINTPSTQNITLYNDGYGSAVNWAGTLSNLPAGFSANTSACSSIAPGGSCNVGITFSPAAFQVYGGGSVAPSGTLSYTNNTLSLSGTGTGTRATLVSGDLNFGTALLDSAPPVKTLTWRNDGNLAMSITLAGLPTQLSISGNTCTNVSPAGTCTTSVTLGTGTLGSWNQSISTSGATSNATVQLVGGVAGSIATLTSSTALSFGTVGYQSTPITRDWAFRNDGNQPLTLSPSALNSAYTVTVNGCQSLAAGANCVIRVRLNTGTAGTFNQSGIAVTGAQRGNRNDLSLAGVVSPPAPVPFTVTLVDGANGIWTVRNNGLVSVVLSALTTDDGGVSSSTCAVGSSVAPGASCTVYTFGGYHCGSGQWYYYLYAANSAGNARGNSPAWTWGDSCGG
jgi:hypothetical protein